MPTPSIDTALEAQRQALINQLVQISDPRTGSHVERFKKRGNPHRRSSHPGTRGHGPRWLLTTKVAGKIRSRVIPTHALEKTCT